MNDRRNENDDESAANDELERFLEPLKQAGPSAIGKARIREAVASALAESATDRARRLPWWRRSISVPIPIAAALVLLALVAAFAGRSGSASSAKVEPQVAAETEPRVNYRASEIFLCGIGKVSSERIFEVRED